MGLMDGKTVVVFGVANKRSIAWGIAKALDREGAKLVLAYQNERMGGALEKLLPELSQTPVTGACDVCEDGSVAAFFAKVQEQVGTLDGMVHSIAFAKREELGDVKFRDTTWDGYALSQQVSAYSLVELGRHAAALMPNGGAIVSMSYLGAVRAVEGYNVMGVAKAALEASTRYLAADVGPDGIRVNAISAGPIKTVSAMGVSGFKSILSQVEERAPLRRNVTQEEVGDTCLFLLSDLSRGMTGQVLYVDSGYSILGV